MASSSNKYDNCIAYSQGTCNSYSKYKNNVDQQLFNISELDKAMKPHLVKLKLKHKYDDCSSFTEKLLIENRLGKQFLNTDQICPYHRFTLGVEWRTKSSCQHPDHIQTKGKNSPSTRAVPITKLYKFMKARNITIPIGTNFCITHLPLNSITCHNEDDADYGTIEKDHKETDPTYQPSTPTVTSEDEEMSNIVLSTMNQVSHSSPVRFAVKRK